MELNKIFKGTMARGYYIVEECPFCGERNALQFFAGFSLYNCVSCSKSGTYEDLLAELAQIPQYSAVVDSLTRPQIAEGFIDIAEFVKPMTGKLSMTTGFGELDKLLDGFQGGQLTVMTGKRAEGKSTIAGQIAANTINAGHKAFFYSGELSAEMFQSWIFKQLAGKNYLEPYVNDFGAQRYKLDKAYAEPHIRNWLKGKLFLYDNTVIKSSEVNTIVDRSEYARGAFGCDLFVIDNLKTARFKKGGEQDHLRKQAEFAGDMLAFAVRNNVHVILVAHPKKEDTGDTNDNVGGLSDITDLATNVIKISKCTEKQKQDFNCDSILELSKNRTNGVTAKMKMMFEPESKRFIPCTGEFISRYGWEDEV